MKLIDFGISKTIQADKTSITCDQVVGTFNYMSPEAIVDLNSGSGARNIKVSGSPAHRTSTFSIFAEIDKIGENPNNISWGRKMICCDDNE